MSLGCQPMRKAGGIDQALKEVLPTNFARILGDSSGYIEAFLKRKLEDGTLKHCCNFRQPIGGAGGCLTQVWSNLFAWQKRCQAVSIAIDFASVPDLDHLNDSRLIVHRIDDPVIPLAYPVTFLAR